MRPKIGDQRGFTLVEVLIVIGIIGVIVGLLVPAMAAFKAESRSSICLQNLRQIYLAVQTYRQQSSDLLPYTQPLPAATPAGPIGGLPDVLKRIMDPKAETFLCPGDTDGRTEAIGTSYLYAAGAFMVLEPPDPALSPLQNVQAAARLVTMRFDTGYLHNMPLLADCEDFHEHGSRLPWNGVFVDGQARALKPDDGVVWQP